MAAWRVFITPAAERALKKLPPALQEFVRADFPAIVKKNPMVGEALSGPLSWLRSFHFRVTGKPYRVAYNLDAKNSKIIIHYAGYRADFYERLRRILGV